MSSELGYADVRVGLRAPRVAVVVDGGMHWTYWVRHAMYEIARTWGGAGFIIIPHQDGNVNPHLLRATVAYDPDYVVLMRKTLGQLEEVEPGAVQINDEHDAQKTIDPERRNKIVADNSSWPIPDSIGNHARSVIAAHCSPYRQVIGSLDEPHEDIHFIDGQKANNGIPRYEIPSPDPAYLSVPTDWGGPLGVAIALRLGSIQAPSAMHDCANEESASAALRWILDGKSSWANPPEAFSFPADASPAALKQCPTVLQASSPGLAWVTSGLGALPILLVIGDSPNDCALAMAYERIYGAAFWLPSQWAVTSESKLGETAKITLDSIIDHQADHNAEFLLTSTSVSEDDLSETLEHLKQSSKPAVSFSIDGGPSQEYPHTDRNIRIGVPLWPSAGRRHLAFAEDYDQRLALPVERSAEGDTTMVAPPPVPMIRDPELASVLDLAWHVDVEMLDSSTPRGRGLPSVALLAPTEDRYLTWVRSARDGISYQSKRWNFILSGTPPELQLARPRLKELGLTSWASSMAQTAGYSIRLSDSGLRARLLAEMWGSRTALTQAIAGPLLPALLQFNSKGKSTKEAYPDGGGCFLRGLGGFLAIDGFLQNWGDGSSKESIRDEVDKLAERGIVRRGLILQCQTCMRPAFVDVGALGQRNQCPRCGETNALSRATWKTPAAEPVWYYDLHPAARELLGQHGAEPMLLSHYLGANRPAFADVPEIEIVKKGKSLVEIDLLAHVSGMVITAEVKTNNTLGGTTSERAAAAKKRVLAAEILHADRILLATTTSAWEPGSVKAIVDEVNSTEWKSMFPPDVSLVTGLGTPSVTERVLAN